MKRIKIYFSLIVILLVFAGAKNAGPDDDIYDRINKNMEIFGKVYKEIALNYVDEIETDKFMKAGIEGMLSTLDPYTNFLDESRKDEIDLLTTGRYAGIGISIAAKDSMVVITEVLEGYSAQKEGLRVGDKILQIDGTPIEGTRIGDVRALVRGASGTQLKMKVLRGEKELDFVLTREEIKLKNISFSGIVENGIGYIKLERFNKNAESEMTEAINGIKSAGLPGELKGIIIDIRDNPGGLLDAAISLLEKFTEKGNLLLTTKGRKPDSEKKYFSATEPLIRKDVPLAILINANSASASEIFAGAIQDLDRGVIVGTKSFGKGLVQVFSPLGYDTRLKITTQKYFTPSGRWIQLKNYFKENKYGVFKPNPYFNQSEFKTLGGRIVFAEGGITPDSIVYPAENNELLEALLSQDMYYRFSEKYVYEHPEVINFAMNEGITGDFYNYLNSQSVGFEYISKAETKASELMKVILEKNYSEKIRHLAAELQNSLKDEMYRDFEKSKPLISRMLERQILKRMNKSEKEIMAASFTTDAQLQAALRILKNPELYNRILNRN